MHVNGIAIKATISRNGIKYTAEELKKFQKLFKNISIQKDHNSSVDASVGLVESSRFENKGGKVKFEGFVKEDGTDLLSKIKDKRISKVSIGAIAGKLVKEKEDDEHLVAVDLIPVELSLVTVPGIVGATIQQTMENLEKNKTDNKIKVKPIAESFDIDETEEEELELTEEEIAVSKKEFGLEEKSVKENDNPKIEEKVEKIIDNQEVVTEENTIDTGIDEKVTTDDNLMEDNKMSEEEIKVKALKEEQGNDAPATEPKEEPKGEPKEEPKAEPKAEPKEEPAAEEKAPVVDLTEMVAKLGEVIGAQLKPLQEEIKKIKEETKKVNEFKSVNTVDEEEVNAFKEANYCIEANRGTYSLFVMPKADGSLR